MHIPLWQLFDSCSCPDDQFSDEDLEFLARYSVKKEGCESKILKELGLISGKEKVQDYYTEHGSVKTAKECIQAIYERFNTKRNSQKEKEHPVDVFGDDFEAFFAWWCEKTPEGGIRKCCYCGVDEDTVRAAFAKDEKDKCVISSKKRSFAYAGLKVHPDRASWCIADGEMVHRHR